MRGSHSTRLRLAHGKPSDVNPEPIFLPRRVECHEQASGASNGLVVRGRLLLSCLKTGSMNRDDPRYLRTLESPPPVDGRAFVYILACSDPAHYIGSTGDLRGRLGQYGGPKGANFTRDHAGGRLVYYEGGFEFAVVLRRERRPKRWTRAKKLALIQNQTLVLTRLSQSRETRRQRPQSGEQLAV